jgi:hypothetical protein
MLAGVNVTDPAVIISNETKGESRDESSSRSETIADRSVLPLPDQKTKPLTEQEILNALSEVKEPTTDTKTPADEKKTITLMDKKNESDDLAQKRGSLITVPRDTTPAPDDSKKSRLAEKKIAPPAGDKKRIESEPPTDLTPPDSSRQVTPSQHNSVDTTIDGPFARGDYVRTIRDLSKTLKDVDAESAARARLFIARSYIELGRYREAVGFLNSVDVKHYYPKESNFWREYSIDQMR